MSAETIYGKPGETFEARVQAATGLVGTMGAQIRDNVSATPVVARATTGIAEDPLGSGSYVIIRTFPSFEGQYALLVDIGSLTPTNVIEIQLVVSESEFVLGSTTLLTRVKERTETDLSDTELQRIINDALADIAARYGPDATSPITVQLSGGDFYLFLARPLDATLAAVVTEYVGSAGMAEVSTIIASNDYRVWHGGRSLQRLVSGTNGRTYWGDRVTVTYTPVSDQAQRDEVTIKLAILAIEYRGLSSERVGDWQGSFADYQAEREKLIASLGSGIG